MAIVLIDCNNFFCSCERLFRPDLAGKPIVVLSNNDGCVISRSNEAKALGIKMGEPFFKVRDLVQQYGVHVFSSNFSLYADMSNRIMQSLREFSPNIEFYSVDEAFLEITGSYDEQVALCHLIRDRLYRHVGLPVSVGCAPTKVLAKAANYFAKRQAYMKGVCVWESPVVWMPYLSQLPVSDIWGIGRRLSKKLEDAGIHSAAQFATFSNSKWIQNHFTKLGRFLQEELLGRPCLELELIKSKRKQIRVSRSFREPLTTPDQVYHALASFLTRAMEKLRSQDSQMQTFRFFCRSNRFDNDRYYSNAKHVAFAMPTADTLLALQALKDAFVEFYRGEIPIKQAGVTLGDFSEAGVEQLSWIDSADVVRSKPLMNALDFLNHRYGDSTCLPASCVALRHSGSHCHSGLDPESNHESYGIDKIPDQVRDDGCDVRDDSCDVRDDGRGVRGLQRRKFESPKYTTSFDDLLTVS